MDYPRTVYLVTEKVRGQPDLLDRGVFGDEEKAKAAVAFIVQQRMAAGLPMEYVAVAYKMFLLDWVHCADMQPPRPLLDEWEAFPDG